ncbi:MAG TPA: multicopper oxidase domain-containing protein [Steroidobacteraceae bacterium]|jgi:FtsP/CotA-like multicopper oxidase with cupredoxin domain|nr:multicopper oxidase domain-containing protein [Steroidobacteraceae bacterium]
MYAKVRRLSGLVAALAATGVVAAPRTSLPADAAGTGPCTRPAMGSEVPEPEDLRAEGGVLKLRLTLRNQRAADGSIRYCYLLGNGVQSPTLRLNPGDTLVLALDNELKDFGAPHSRPHSHSHPPHGASNSACGAPVMSLITTNLHFHGLTVPPVCHQDDVLKTSIQPGQAPFEYRFRIPLDEPPGLYWYHPHIHGFSTPQVLGGASGALIIEGIERAEPQAAGLAERVLVIRDQDLLNPDAPPSRNEPVVPKMFIDRDGDAANNGTGFGKPAKDLSINYVPVPYPDYPPASITMRPEERQLWRVLNASAVTYLNLAVLFRGRPQPLGIVALDGVPLSTNGNPANEIEWRDHIGLPPGSRAEFIVRGPPPGVPGLLVTRTVDTGQGGENDPNRALASITARADASEPGSILPTASGPAARASRPWLGDVPPVRVRKLYFSEKLSNPADPNSATQFYLTVEGQTPKPFDPASSQPDIVVKQGDVEDWIIENRSTELHAFHIHQLHFLLLDWSGVPVNEPFLRDTVNVPYYKPTMLQYPSVRLRMDFRDPNIVGTFVYHCHLLEHEDGGMMGTIRVEPAR